MSTVRSPPSKSTPHTMSSSRSRAKNLPRCRARKRSSSYSRGVRGRAPPDRSRARAPDRSSVRSGRDRTSAEWMWRLRNDSRAETRQHLGGRVGGQQEVVGVRRPVRLTQVARGEQGQARRRRQVIAPGVPQQPLGVAQGQAVVRLGQVRQQNVRRTPRECLAQSRHRSHAPVQERMGHGVAGVPQGARQGAGRSTFV